jgi:GT2 family glycosyltransferase
MLKVENGKGENLKRKAWAPQFLLVKYNTSINKVYTGVKFIRGIRNYIRLNGSSILIVNIKKLWETLQREGLHRTWSKVKKCGTLNSENEDYECKVEQYNFNKEDKKKFLSQIQEFNYRPVFSIIVPVYNIDECWLRKCIESVISQVYPDWELCLADDASSKEHIRKILEEYVARDSRIKVVFRTENGHISAASNSALDMASGDYITLLDNDDELTLDALYENALLINKYPEADLIYSDEDKITIEGKRIEPFFKPDWSPELFRSQMYVGHLCIMRRSLVKEVGGFRQGFEGSQDYDLVLRIVEKTNQIFHIPKVLYHWRKLPTSTAGGFAAKPYAHEAGLLALTEHAARIWGKENCQVSSTEQYFQYSFYFPIPNQPLVSIIIPTRDHHELLETCLQSILAKTTYPNFEIIILNNNSEKPETFAYLEKVKKDKQYRARVIDAPIPFNWSKLNNIGVHEAQGEFFVFLNNDIEIITENWLEWLVGYASREDIGVVGPMLLYPDNTIQHAGVVIGIGGYADHVYKGQKIDTAQDCFVSPNLIRNVSAVTGACLVIAREKLEKYGLFDEKFIICGSDVEICLRLMKANLYNVYIPQVKLYHHESKTRDSYIPESDFVMSKKAYQDFLQYGDPYYNPNLSLEGTNARFNGNK